MAPSATLRVGGPVRSPPRLRGSNARLAPARSVSRARASGRHGAGGLVFVSGDPNDARLEGGLGIPSRFDLRQHGIHRYGRVPIPDLSTKHAGTGITRIR